MNTDFDKLPLEKIKLKLKSDKFDAVLISSHSNILYLTHFPNFSIFERDAYLFITPNKQYIITDGRYTESVNNTIKNFELIKRTLNLPVKKILRNLIKQHGIKTLGIEEDDLSVKEFKEFSGFVRTYFLKTPDLRSVKNTKEIEHIKNACLLTDKTYLYILKKIKPGITEKQLAFEIEYFIKKSGADISFETIVAFGKNSSVPHHKTGVTKLKNQNIILLDFGVKLNNYCSDFTRTIYFGKAPNKFKKMYQTTLQAQKEAVDFIKQTKKPRAAEADNIARSYIKSKGFSSIPHSLGHGVGIKIHEHPSLSQKSKDVLKKGMVFTLEPGIYLPGYGGVRIEDTYCLTENGLEQLTKSSKDLIEL